MTTSRSRVCGTGLALAAALLAVPAFAQELELPSGHSARLFDVVLEHGAGPTAPAAFTDPELSEAGAIPEDLPLTEAPPPSDTFPGASDGGLARLRLVVEGLGGDGLGYDAVAGDFLWLCQQVALPALAANAWAPAEVVITLSDRETEFGLADPEAVQFFEGFRVVDGTCVPQAF
jgi:hypothetical protein